MGGVRTLCYGRMILRVTVFLIFSLISQDVLSEEYLCSGIVGDETETKSYERKGNHFLYTTQGWKFRILHENERHLMLGWIEYYESTTNTNLFLTIIDKKTLNFTERYISSENNMDSFLGGKCSLKK